VTVLDRCNELIPNSKVPYNYFNMLMVESYYKAAGKTIPGESKDSLRITPVNINPAIISKANAVVRVMAKNCEEELIYYFSLEPQLRATVQEDLQRAYYIMKSLIDMTSQYGEKQLGAEVGKQLNDLLTVYQPELAEPPLKH